MDSKRGDGQGQDLSAEDWHLKLLPLMRGGLVALAAFFFLASLVQYHLLYQDLRGKGPATQMVLDALEKNIPDAQRTKPDFIQWKVLVLLEQDAMRLRYQQINATLLLRTWTRYTGFLVGMVLALVGAFFILGRLREETSQLSGESAAFKVMLTTSSPGIVLAVLGTILMVVTLAVKFDFEVVDRPVYLPLLALSGKTGESLEGNRASTEEGTRTGVPRPKPTPPGKEFNAPPIGPDDFPKPPGKKPQ